MFYFKSKNIDFFQVPIQVKIETCRLRTLRGKESMIEHKGLRVGQFYQSGDLQVGQYFVDRNYIQLISNSNVELSSLDYDILSEK